MLEEFMSRENHIFDALQRLKGEGLDFVVVGGYAVSSYRHRFSVDADIVVTEGDVGKFQKALGDIGFKETVTRELENVYSSRFIRFEKRERLPVYIDVLVGGVAVRQTGAVFGFDLLREYSSEREIAGAEKKVRVAVPSKELLIAMKLHSGRLTDYRDIAALAYDVDIKLLKDVTLRGDIGVVKEHADMLAGLIGKQEFMDSFKGVFEEKKYRIDANEVRRVASVFSEKTKKK